MHIYPIQINIWQTRGEVNLKVDSIALFIQTKHFLFSDYEQNVVNKAGISSQTMAFPKPNQVGFFLSESNQNISTVLQQERNRKMDLNRHKVKA